MRHQSLASVSVEVAAKGNYDRGKLASYRSWRRVDISTFSRVPPELTNTLVIPDHGAEPSPASTQWRTGGPGPGAGLAGLGWAGLVCGCSDTTGGGADTWRCPTSHTRHISSRHTAADLPTTATSSRAQDVKQIISPRSGFLTDFSDGIGQSKSSYCIVT